MFKEIERKFLLKSFPRTPEVSSYKRFEQGYLESFGLIKERFTLHYSHPPKFKRAVKVGSGIERFEFQEDISKEFFDRVWSLTEGKRVYKERFFIKSVEDHGLTWELDRYLDRELCIVEIELPSQELDITLPVWILEVLDREVTEEQAFEGYFLGK